MAKEAAWQGDRRLAGLRRFAMAITLLNLLGHTILGFEQAWAQPLVALLTAYSLELLLEFADAHMNHRESVLSRGWRNLVDFLLPAHISALAIAMLIYSNEALAPTVFAVTAAIASKAIFRVPAGSGSRHFLNPSNFGIILTLLLLPSVGLAPPYQFTENLAGWWDWLLVGLFVLSGTYINARFSGRLPVVLGWLLGFVVQAIVRSLVFGSNLMAVLAPITGVAFILYTFYMITDPATTPNKPTHQILFGLAVATVYGWLQVLHIVFGLFFALAIVTVARGIGLWFVALAKRFGQPNVQAPEKPLVVVGSEDR